MSGARLAAGDTVNMLQNASAMPQLELASRASMSPLALAVATCDDGLIVHVDGVDAGTYLTLRVQSGSVVVSRFMMVLRV